jgi:CheY-like chemotaxis protein
MLGTKESTTHDDQQIVQKMTGAKLSDILDSRSLHSKANKVQHSKVIRKLLIIDDDLDMSSALADYLKERYSCRVDIAADPFEAMNCMAESYYDLIVLDWKLPVFTGEQTLRQAETDLFFEPSLSIKWDTEKVPVIIISSSEKEKCSFTKTKHFSCVGFISKVQPLGKIFERLSQFIDEKEKSNTLIA